MLYIAPTGITIGGLGTDYGWFLLGLLVVPAAGALLSLAFSHKAISRPLVMVTVAILWILSLVLFLVMISHDVWNFTVPAGGYFDPDPLMLAFEMLLPLVFGYIGLRRKNWSVVILAVIVFTLSIYLETLLHGNGASTWAYVDRLTLLMLLITNLIGGAICVFSLKYMEHDQHQGRFFAVMFLFIAAMNGAVISSDMVWLFMFWEATTFCSYALIAHDGTDQANRAAERALALTMVGGVGFIAAMVFIASSDPDLDLLHLTFGASIPFLALPLLMISAFTKSAQVPFQSWLVGAMVAPTPVSALLHSATMVNLGVYLLMRTWTWYSADQALCSMLLLVGGVTFLASSIMALRQSDAKRVLAYSTIGTLGLIFMCLGIGTYYGLAAAFLLLMSHAVAKAILFLSVGAIKHESGSQDVEDMEGLLGERPFLAYSIYLGVFLMLLPPFGVFAGKLILLESLFDRPWVALLIVIGLAAMTVYYGKWLGRTLVARAVAVPRKETHIMFRAPLLLLIYMALLLVLLMVPFMQVFVGLFNFHVGTVLWPIGTQWYELGFGLGLLPLFIILVVMAFSFLLLTSWVRRPEESTTPYACGETMEIDITGHYLYSERLEVSIRRSFEVLGIVLLIVLLVIPYLLEASA